MSNKPYTLVVGVDYSELSDRALNEAFAQAAQRADAEIHVLTALPTPVSEDPAYALVAYGALDEKPILSAALQKLRGHVELLLQRFCQAQPTLVARFRVISHAIVDAPAQALVRLAFQLDADLILLGTHNRKGVARLLLGSVAEGTVRNSPCPVLVIPAPAQRDSEVAIDPPCPECVRTRAASNGKEFWCEQHRERHGRRHTYHQSDRSSFDSNFPLVYR